MQTDNTTVDRNGTNEVRVTIPTDSETDVSSPEEKDTDEEEGVILETCNPRSVEGKRCWKKEHCCIYCQKYVSKMARHLIDCHIHEQEIKEACQLEINSLERRRVFEKLLCVGDYYHNMDVLETGKGSLIVLRRPTNTELSERDIKATDYSPCPGCLGFVTKHDLWRHVKRCKEMSSYKQERTSAQQASRLLMFSVSSVIKIPQKFRTQIISRMRSDGTTKTLIKDWLIIQVGLFLFKQYGASQYNLISQRMRLLSTLLRKMRENTNAPNLNLLQCIDAEKFDTIVQAVHELCALESNQHSRPQMKARPSFGLRVGHELRRCGELARNIALKQHDKAMLKKAESFLQVRNFEWPSVVSGPALSTLSKQKQNKPDLLPCTDDMIKLVQYLKTHMSELGEQLNDQVQSRSWHELCELALTRVIVFNKRRAGEVSKMTLEAYQNRAKWHAASATEFRAVLSSLETKLVDRMELIKITGKKGSSAPVLLTNDMVTAIDTVTKLRQQIGIDIENPYLFPNDLSRTGEPLRGHDCIRKHALAAETKHPERITSTKLRKYMATVSQIFELNEVEIEWLARHLTHDIRVHREFYRLHDSSVELAKVSKLLLAVESGKPGSWKGCKLDEINLEMVGLTENELGLSDDSDDEEAVNTESRPSAACCLPSTSTVTTTDTSMLSDDYEYEEAASTESRSPSSHRSQSSSPAWNTGKKIAPIKCI